MNKERDTGAERVWAFSDGVFAVIITILVLELKPPKMPDWSGLRALWPTGLSYALSYAFIAIIWVNHHHLMRYATSARPTLMWANFAHLFCVSLVPFTTAWMADSRFSAVPVSVYAGLFALINFTYIFLCMEALDRSPDVEVTSAAKQLMRMRAVITLAIFLLGAATALWSPSLGFALVCLCLVTYAWPEARRAVGS
jgi:uncharacterized membrane protein